MAVGYAIWAVAAAAPVATAAVGGAGATQADKAQRLVTNFGGVGQQIGVIRVGERAGVALEGRGPGGISHLELAKKAFGALAEGERRLGFSIEGGNVLVGGSSTGFLPTANDLPAIAEGLRTPGVQGQALVLIGNKWVLLP